MNLQEKRIVVTGGNGFLGRHVVARLRALGCRDVFVPRSAQYDLTQAIAVEKLLLKQRPEVVLHLAATVGGIGANQRDPAKFFYDNLMMGCQLMEGCRRIGTEKFLTVGTTCSYPKNTPIPFRESELWNGYPEETTAPYGLAKKMLIVQAKTYRQQYDFHAIHLLLTNLYGPGDHFDLETSHVVPALIRKCLEAKQRREKVLSVWGTGRATRDFLYVTDAVSAIISALERSEDPEPINVGSGVETPIASLVKLIANKVGFPGEIRFDPSRPDGQPRRCLDVTRAKELLSFRATVSLSEGLDRTLRWYEGRQAA